MPAVRTGNLQRIWELAGIAVIFLVGSLFHFIFELSGGWRPVALIGAVNESVWEHLKIAFMPAFLYALIEYPFIGKRVNNFWLAKSLGLFAIPLSIIVLFYGYTAVLGHHYLPVDIFIFLAAIVAGQLLSCRVFSVPDKGLYWRIFGAILLAAMAAAFLLLTYYPPHIFLFRNPLTNGYGIPYNFP